MACDVEEPMPLVKRSEAGSWAGGVRAGQPKSASGENPSDRENLVNVQGHSDKEMEYT